MPEFVDDLRDVVQKNSSSLLNVTIRTVHKDDRTSARQARHVQLRTLLHVKFNDKDNEVLEKTSTELIDVAQRVGRT